MLTICLFAISVVFAFSMDSMQFGKDLLEFSSIGVQYFNVSGSCSVPSNYSLIPVVTVNTVVDLLQMSIQRKKYPAKSIVYFDLTAVDFVDAAGVFYPAYLLQSALHLYPNMSCSYIKGSGLTTTSILVDYTNISTASSAMFISAGVHDLILVDVTVDRTNSSWWTPGYECSIATNYPNLIPNNQAAAVLQTNSCKGFYSHHLDLNFPYPTTNHAIKVQYFLR